MPFAIKIQRWHVTFPQWYALIRKSSATVCHFIAYYFNSNTDPCDVRPHPLLIELSDSLPSKSWRGKMIRLLAEYIFVDVRPFLGHAATQPLQLYIVCCLEFKDRRYSRFYAHYRAYTDCQMVLRIYNNNMWYTIYVILKALRNEKNFLSHFDYVSQILFHPKGVFAWINRSEEKRYRRREFLSRRSERSTININCQSAF